MSQTSKSSLRFIVPILFGLGVLLVWFVFLYDSQPPWPKFEGSIFVAIQTEVGPDQASAKGGVFELQSESQSIRQLTENLPSRFDLTSDSEWLAWAAGNQIAMQNLNAASDTELRRFDAAGLSGSPVCGDDGTWMAWTSASMEVAEAMVTQRLEFSAEDAEVITQVKSPAVIWDWSGQRQAFLATTDSNLSASDILMIDAQGRLTVVSEEGLNTSPRFSHDQNHVLFVHQEAGLSSIMRYDLKNDTSSTVYGPTAMVIRECCWSPDDSSIAFLISEDHKAIQILKLGDDTTPERLLVGRSKWMGGLIWNRR